jgi:hypothetical protein
LLASRSNPTAVNVATCEESRRAEIHEPEAERPIDDAADRDRRLIQVAIAIRGDTEAERAADECDQVRREEERHPEQRRADRVFIRRQPGRRRAIRDSRQPVIGVFVREIQVVVDHQRPDIDIVVRAIGADELSIDARNPQQRQEEQQREQKQSGEHPPRLKIAWWALGAIRERSR